MRNHGRLFRPHVAGERGSSMHCQTPLAAGCKVTIWSHSGHSVHGFACLKPQSTIPFDQLVCMNAATAAASRYSFLRSMHGDDAAIPATMLRGHSNAMQLLCKLLYLEEQPDATE